MMYINIYLSFWLCVLPLNIYWLCKVREILLKRYVAFTWEALIKYSLIWHEFIAPELRSKHALRHLTILFSPRFCPFHFLPFKKFRGLLWQADHAPPRDICVLIPQICECYLTWQKDFAEVIKLKALRWRNYYRMASVVSPEGGGRGPGVQECGGR